MVVIKFDQQNHQKIQTENGSIPGGGTPGGDLDDAWDDAWAGRPSHMKLSRVKTQIIDSETIFVFEAVKQKRLQSVNRHIVGFTFSFLELYGLCCLDLGPQF